MSKYRISQAEVHISEYDVSANSPEEAISKLVNSDIFNIENGIIIIKAHEDVNMIDTEMSHIDLSSGFDCEYLDLDRDKALKYNLLDRSDIVASIVEIEELK